MCNPYRPIWVPSSVYRQAVSRLTYQVDWITWLIGLFGWLGYLVDWVTILLGYQLIELHGWLGYLVRWVTWLIGLPVCFGSFKCLSACCWCDTIGPLSDQRVNSLGLNKFKEWENKSFLKRPFHQVKQTSPALQKCATLNSVFPSLSPKRSSVTSEWLELSYPNCHTTFSVANL